MKTEITLNTRNYIQLQNAIEQSPLTENEFINLLLEKSISKYTLGELVIE